LTSFELLLVSAVFRVRHGAGRNGARLVGRDYLRINLRTTKPKNYKQRTIAPEQSGVVKEEKISLFTTRGEIPLNWTTHKTYGMGASGAANGEAAPQWIHRESIRTSRVPLLSWD
jgi:hypothetical protein